MANFRWIALRVSWLGAALQPRQVRVNKSQSRCLGLGSSTPKGGHLRLAVRASGVR
jgi:hypothetical protein